jgi:hypothetical protein
VITDRAKRGRVNTLCEWQKITAENGKVFKTSPLSHVLEAKRDEFSVTVEVWGEKIKKG